VPHIALGGELARQAGLERIRRHNPSIADLPGWGVVRQIHVLFLKARFVITILPVMTLRKSDAPMGDD
jgi:hypothetical protein